MKIKTKRQIASFSIWVIVVTLVIIALFFFGFLISNTFDLNVFTNRTSEFIWILFGASMVIVICGAFLNISLNIGIIADQRIEQIESLTHVPPKRNLKPLLIVLSTLIFITGFLFLGDYLTRRNEKQKLISICQEIIHNYDNSIQNITAALADTSRVKEIPENLNFLSSQKNEFPSIVLITSDTVNNQLTFLKIASYNQEEFFTHTIYKKSYYPCEDNDCDYLTKVFTSSHSEHLFWTEKNNYRLYYPITNGQKKYVLLFSKYERHGKLGS